MNEYDILLTRSVPLLCTAEEERLAKILATYQFGGAPDAWDAIGGPQRIDCIKAARAARAALKEWQP